MLGMHIRCQISKFLDLFKGSFGSAGLECSPFHPDRPGRFENRSNVEQLFVYIWTGIETGPTGPFLYLLGPKQNPSSLGPEQILSGVSRGGDNAA
jgi:hypothetical protein